jgi:hypothetical protein
MTSVTWIDIDDFEANHITRGKSVEAEYRTCLEFPFSRTLPLWTGFPGEGLSDRDNRRTSIEFQQTGEIKQYCDSHFRSVVSTI